MPVFDDTRNSSHTALFLHDVSADEILEWKCSNVHTGINTPSCSSTLVAT